MEGETMRNSPLAKSDESASSIRGEHWLGDAAVLEGEMLDGNDPIQPGNVHSAVVGGLTDVKSLPLEPPSVENEADDNNENADDDDFGAFGGALEADEMPTLSDEGPEEDEYVKSMDKPVGVSEGAVVNAAVVGGLTDIELLPLEPPSVENEADDNNENADDDDFGAFGGALEADEMPTLSDEGPEEDGLPVEYQHGITGMNVAGSALESLVQANETMSLSMQKSSAEPGWGLLDRLKKSLPDIFPVREKSADQDVVINSLGDSDDLHCIATSLVSYIAVVPFCKELLSHGFVFDSLRIYLEVGAALFWFRRLRIGLRLAFYSPLNRQADLFQPLSPPTKPRNPLSISVVLWSASSRFREQQIKNSHARSKIRSKCLHLVKMLARSCTQPAKARRK
jgi:hypothetical protein